jgi:hypothetical protein
MAFPGFPCVRALTARLASAGLLRRPSGPTLRENPLKMLGAPRATAHAGLAAEALGFDPLTGAGRPRVGQARNEESGEGMGGRGHDARIWAAGPIRGRVHFLTLICGFSSCYPQLRFVRHAHRINGFSGSGVSSHRALAQARARK